MSNCLCIAPQKSRKNLTFALLQTAYLVWVNDVETRPQSCRISKCFSRLHLPRGALTRQNWSAWLNVALMFWTFFHLRSRKSRFFTQISGCNFQSKAKSYIKIASWVGLCNNLVVLLLGTAFLWANNDYKDMYYSKWASIEKQFPFFSILLSEVLLLLKLEMDRG